MPFCTQCGKKVQDTDVFCGYCGARQSGAPGNYTPPAASSPIGPEPLPLNSRTAAILCYIPVLGWIPAIIVLASAKFRGDTQARFHAFQGLYLFVAWLLVDWVIKPVFAISGMGDWPGPFVHTLFAEGLLKAILIGVWIFMLVKVSQNEAYHLPIIGELADRSVAGK